MENKSVIDLLKGSYWSRKQFESKLMPKKVYCAKILGKDGEEYWFKSKKKRIFFERKCDLSNALNHALRADCKEEWIKKWGDQIVIEERYIK